MQKTEFLESYQRFQLGALPTEQSHSKTKGLSEVIKTDLKAGITLLKDVDLLALESFREHAEPIERLRKAAKTVLDDGGKIFLCGCGATGRLSMLSEFLWREKYATDQVVSFMAGGDVALVHSLEGFEDYPDLGAKHLLQMGFTENDLLISSTEGGETPFVIGATEAASQISKYKPYFLYCNPTEILSEKVARSKKVIENTNIEKICLYVGCMALSGSTRMQASTVLQLAVGCALIETDQPVLTIIDEFIEEVKNCDFSLLHDFIHKEVSIYQDGEYLMYVPREFAITVFTDTTERSPTFSQPSFENNEYKGEDPSLCYILIPSAETAKDAWQKLLLHEPHALDWEEIDLQTTNQYLQSFDFSKNSQESREQRVGDKRQYLFEIDCKRDQLLMSLAGIEGEWNFKTKRSLLRHTLVKLMLNTHSTLLMGLMERYQSNIMTWVTATNGKLIDRAARYVEILLEEQGKSVEYLKIIDKIYEYQPNLKKDECIVLKVLKSF